MMMIFGKAKCLVVGVEADFSTLNPPPTYRILLTISGVRRTTAGFVVMATYLKEKKN